MTTRPGLFEDADQSIWSNISVGGDRLMWSEAAKKHEEEVARLQKLVSVLYDLDRCQHGRHEGDVCSDCGGPSKGNPLLPSNRQIGFDISGRSIVVPDRDKKQDESSWRARA